ncbi:MAG: TIGR02186 family protein [Nitrospirae bacterium]|nr:TIGR02186 family protein [Nitrospirota bacterium]
MKTLLKAAAYLIVGVILLVASHKAEANLTLKANHDHIKVDFFYHGSTVTVSGQSELDSDLIIKISSPEGHQGFKKKGKAAGFLWMNLGEINFDHAPNLYFLHSTKRLQEMLSPEEADANTIGYSAIGKHMEITPVKDETERANWFEEFVKFKESSRLYYTSTGNIALSQEKGTQDFSIKLDWPYEASPGNYTVTVYAVKDNHIVEKAETPVLVEQVGLIKFLAGMAKENGALYGIISIAIALGAGFGVGLIFRKGGGAH